MGKVNEPVLSRGALVLKIARLLRGFRILRVVDFCVMWVKRMMGFNTTRKLIYLKAKIGGTDTKNPSWLVENQGLYPP